MSRMSDLCFSFGVSIAMASCGAADLGSENVAPVDTSSTVQTYVEGELGGRPFQGYDAESGVSPYDGSLIISSTASSCGWYLQQELPPSSTLLSFMLVNITGVGVVHPPTEPGVYQIIDVSTNPPPKLGTFAYLKSITTDTQCVELGSLDQHGVSGAVYIDQIKGETYRGRLAVTLSGGGHVGGRFQSHFCKPLENPAMISQCKPCGNP